MLKFITEREQLKNANIELARLRALVGELPQKEIIEGEDIALDTIASKLGVAETDIVDVKEVIDTLFGGAI